MFDFNFEELTREQKEKYLQRLGWEGPFQPDKNNLDRLIFFASVCSTL